MKKSLFLFVFCLFTGVFAHAQGITTVLLDATNHGSVQPIGGDGTRIFDDGSDGNYSAGIDYWLTITGACSGPYKYVFTVEELSIAQGDTMFIYDGPSTSSPLLWTATGIGGGLVEVSPETYEVFASPNNTAQALTVRLKTRNNSPTAGGFAILVGCKKPCESVVPHIDSIYYKTRNGQIYEFGRIKHLYDIDTVTDSHGNDSLVHVPFEGLNLCMGDGVIINGHCDYTYTTGWYTPKDATSMFHWDLSLNNDSVVGIGVSSVYYDQYIRVGCYDVTLRVEDTMGCTSTTFPVVRVRVAQNPLKTLFTLDEICNRDSLYVNMGYDGDNATLTLAHIEYEDMVSKTYEVRTFVPDGPNCPVQCYQAPVEFTNFPGGRKVVDAGDICSICVNYEHEFMGDYSLAIICPNYLQPGFPNGQGRAVLKYKDNSPAGSPAGTSAGGSRYTGIPYGGDGHHSYDGTGGNAYCDSIYNPYGVGWPYCFSRNPDYTFVNGQPCDTPMPNNSGMANGPTVNATVNFWQVPAGYSQAGQSCGSVTVSTLDSSNHAEKTDYYVPADSFQKLVGCDLNGTWKIELCDNWGSDNGWVFSWSLDICGVSDGGCKYQVAIDSVVWAPDTVHTNEDGNPYYDYDLGHYRGVEVHKHNDLEAYILTPDTAGKFRLNVTIYDEFGCVWDTNTTITSHWTPNPQLGPDTTLCGVMQMELDASDPHAASNNYSYIWAPFGQNTPQITTAVEPDGDVTYVSHVINRLVGGTVCETRDTINVKLRRQPLPSFEPEPFAFEGCDPMTLTFKNQSVDAYYHRWEFGDGITSEIESPTHTYSEGIYDLRYYVTSKDGCVDSLILPQAIAVYPAPKAAFSWAPTYPSVLNPVMHLENRTEPQAWNNKYYWEVQYDPNNPYSVETVTGDSPEFDFSSFADPADMPGNYTVRLIARTQNLAPTGNIIACDDTTESTVLLVNDYLQFPNVVTPNGDGINDKFIIGGLVGGLGYPINSLDVYNKWGSHVFHRDNISKEEDFWDPSTVPSGTYFYRFTAKGYNGNIEHNGAVEVVK